MQLAQAGRTVFIAQWVLAVFLPVFVFIGRGFVGAQLGWMSVIGIVYGVFLIIALLVPPIIALFDAEARRARSVRQSYSLASAVLWLGLVMVGLTIPDAGDSGNLETALTAWFGISYESSVVIFAISAAAALLAWLVAIATAIAGIVRSRRAA